MNEDWPDKRMLKEAFKLDDPRVNKTRLFSLRGIVELVKPHKKTGTHVTSIEAVRFGYTDTPLQDDNQ
jgi:hypothetical protein